MSHRFLRFAITSVVVGLGAACARSPTSGETMPHAPRARAHATLIPAPTFRAATQPELAPVPSVFISVGAIADHSGRLPHTEVARLTAIVESAVARTGYATRWPGRLPTSEELRTSRSRAFAVAATVTQVEVMPGGDGAQIACRVSVTISPWNGTDGEQRWASGTTALASGSGRVTAGPHPGQLERAIQDCTHQVIEDVTSRHVLPFLRRVAVVD